LFEEKLLLVGVVGLVVGHQFEEKVLAVEVCLLYLERALSVYYSHWVRIGPIFAPPSVDMVYL